MLLQSSQLLKVPNFTIPWPAHPPNSTHLGSNEILDALTCPTHAIRPTLMPLLIEQIRDALFVAHALFAAAEGLEADDFAALFQVEEFV
jgi:hypothetical protein